MPNFLRHEGRDLCTSGVVSAAWQVTEACEHTKRSGFKPLPMFTS